MAFAVSQLNTAQLIGFTVALGLFIVMMVGIIAIMAVLASTGVGWVAVALLASFGAAVMLIGAGVFLAAAGIGLMAYGIGTLVKSFSGLSAVTTDLLALIEVASDFTALAKDFEKIGKAINSIPETKAVAVAMTMTAAAEAAMATSPTVIEKNIKTGAANLNATGGGTKIESITLKLDAAQTRKLFTDGVVKTKDIEMGLAQGSGR
jgi:hypothetical protein